MYRAIVVTIGVLAVFGFVLIVTLMARKKSTDSKQNPYLEEFESYQEDMMTNGYDISYEDQPTELKETEDLIYQLRGKVSDVDLGLEDPETKPDPSTLWVTNKRLIIERRGKTKQGYEFDFQEIDGFEFELEKNNYVFLFDYKEKTLKIQVRDIYGLALIELKTRIKKKITA